MAQENKLNDFVEFFVSTKQWSVLHAFLRKQGKERRAETRATVLFWKGVCLLKQGIFSPFPRSPLSHPPTKDPSNHQPIASTNCRMMDCTKVRLWQLSIKGCSQLNLVFLKTWHAQGLVECSLFDEDADPSHVSSVKNKLRKVSKSNDPESIGSHIVLSTYFRAIGRGKQSRHFAEKAVSIDENNSKAQSALGWAYLSLDSSAHKAAHPFSKALVLHFFWFFFTFFVFQIRTENVTRKRSPYLRLIRSFPRLSRKKQLGKGNRMRGSYYRA